MQSPIRVYRPNRVSSLAGTEESLPETSYVIWSGIKVDREELSLIVRKEEDIQVNDILVVLYN